MITTILSLVGGGLGGLLRFIPELLKLFSEQKDRDHELRMTQLQLEIDKARATQQIDLVHAQSAMAESAGEMQAYIEAMRGQSQLTHVGWVDAINATVRPFITYWWMLLFTAYKAGTLWHAFEQEMGFDALMQALWSGNDWGVLSMILGFWFVDRSIRKQQGK